MCENKSLVRSHILLMFQFDLTYYIRIRQNIQYLQNAGAKISLLTSTNNDASSCFFDRVYMVSSYEYEEDYSHLFLNIPEKIKKVIYKIFGMLNRFINLKLKKIRSSDICLKTIVEIKDKIDIIWAVDSVSLPSAYRAVKILNIPIIYETVDLVPEINCIPALSKWRKQEEYIGLPYITALITAGEKYKDYYLEKYKEILDNKPVLVRNNSHLPISDKCKRTGDIRKILFFGNLVSDRPVEKILYAFARSRAKATLTFYGRYLLKEDINDLISNLGVENKVFIEKPVPPEMGVELSSEYDIGIVALEGGDLNEQLAPTGKIGTYLAAGLAIVASDLPGIRSHLGKTDALYVDECSIDAWAKAFDQITTENDDKLMFRKQSSLMRCKEMDYNIQMKKYVKLFASIYKNKEIN